MECLFGFFMSMVSMFVVVGSLYFGIKFGEVKVIDLVFVVLGFFGVLGVGEIMVFVYCGLFEFGCILDVVCWVDV